MIVLPGGGHGLLVIEGEGARPAELLNRMGITVFVLKYRLARETDSTYSIEGDAAGDTARAVQWGRANAAQQGVDPKRIGLMGFSAGGELVSLVANYPRKYAKASDDSLSSVSARPDFRSWSTRGRLRSKGLSPPPRRPPFWWRGPKTNVALLRPGNCMACSPVQGCPRSCTCSPERGTDSIWTGQTGFRSRAGPTACSTGCSTMAGWAIAALHRAKCP